MFQDTFDMGGGHTSISPSAISGHRLYASHTRRARELVAYAFGMAEHLVTGDRLPALNGTDLEGNEVDITASVAGSWAVVLFYRGDW